MWLVRVPDKGDPQTYEIDPMTIRWRFMAGKEWHPTKRKPKTWRYGVTSEHPTLCGSGWASICDSPLSVFQAITQARAA